MLSGYCLLFALSLQTVQAQVSEESENYLNWFDQKVGIENTALYEGIIYRETYRTINDKVKFYSTAQWLNGSVVYNGQLFSNIQLKYDIFGDELLVRQEDRLMGGALLLYKKKVSAFRLNGSEFIHLQDLSSESAPKGYYQLLLSKENTKLFAKHQKRDFLKRDRSSLYHEFVDQDKIYVVNYAGAYHLVNSKKEVIKAYPGQKKQIDSFYQKNKRLRGRDIDAFMISLINTMDELVSSDQSNTGI